MLTQFMIDLTPAQTDNLVRMSRELRRDPNEIVRHIVAEALHPEPHDSHDIDRCDPFGAICQECGQLGNQDSIAKPCPGWVG